MNSLKAKLIVAAATLTIAATAASAQQTKLTASIPFAFSAGAQQSFPAGSYQISATSTHVWRLTNADSRNAKLVAGGSPTVSRWDDRPQLVFECRGNSCSLRKIQTGNGESGYELPAPKRSKSDEDELARVVVVPATVSNAD